MARLSPEQQIRRIVQTIRGWEKHAPNRTFSRRTFAEFKEAMQPSLDAHGKVVGLRKQLHIAVVERNAVVRKAMQVVYMIGDAARGDPEHGRNSDLNEALGYTREAVRRMKIRRTTRRKRAKRGSHSISKVI